MGGWVDRGVGRDGRTEENRRESGMDKRKEVGREWEMVGRMKVGR